MRRKFLSPSDKNSEQREEASRTRQANQGGQSSEIPASKENESGKRGEIENKLARFKDILGKYTKKPLSEALGVTDALRDSLYARAYRQFRAGRFQRAQPFFAFLFSVEPQNRDYALGYLATSYDCGQIQKTLKIAKIARVLHPKEALIHFYCLACATRLGLWEEARASYTEFTDCLTEATPQQFRTEAVRFLEAIHANEQAPVPTKAPSPKTPQPPR